VRYAALKATEYQCTVDCLSLDSKHISLPMHELKFPVHILAAHARNILCGPSIFSQHSGVHVLGLALLRHLSMIWVQARQITSLPLIYITLLGLHTLFLEVYDQKDITGEEKKETIVSPYKKDMHHCSASAESHLPRELPSQSERCAVQANLETEDHHCKTDSYYPENDGQAEGEETDKGHEKHESPIDSWRRILATRMYNVTWIVQISVRLAKQQAPSLFSPLLSFA